MLSPVSTTPPFVPLFSSDNCEQAKYFFKKLAAGLRMAGGGGGGG